MTVWWVRSNDWLGVTTDLLEVLGGSVAGRPNKSCPDVLHERGNLHELDARAHTVETGHPLE